MPEFLAKKQKVTNEAKEYLASLSNEDYIRILIETVTPKARLRRSFHVLLDYWYKTQEYSCDAKSLKGLKRYYKFCGTDWFTASYTYKGDEFKTSEELYDSYPDFIPENVVREPKHWEDMIKSEQCKALDTMLTEIDVSCTTDYQVRKWQARIKGDTDMLKWLKWDEYQVNKVSNKFNGQIIER